ncbi:heavy metal translocating P-type ATPase [Candidimonas nitroreducens]|uniref:Heavy metal translocating P-type ATPase n=1 Tax=Candidimonas nitroreducens TaxID=683354 RepID=A0A225MB51_9BURK|nr:HAD-IC family P-type ATPase [Candidimonas nitroreducens]OWT57513.1 heavy metal translocating P-type ATPase [Candidimonas nitroreducens]
MELWGDPRLAAQVLRSRRDGCSEAALRVEPLDDARQVLRLEQHIRALPGVRRLTIDAPARRVRVVWDAARLTLPALLQACAAAGCGAQPLRRDSIDDRRVEARHDLLKRLLVAGMCSMQVMTFAFVIYIGAVDMVDFSTRALFRWLCLLVTIPCVGYCAMPFYRNALRDLRRGRLGIDLPVTLAIVPVFAASAFNTLRGQGEIYFDSIGMFIFLLLGARYLELRARHHSAAQSDAALDAAPLLAQRYGADGALETVPAMQLLPGDRVRIAPGDIVPADGLLESAEARLDEALLSGESGPVLHRRGARLAAGSLLLGAAIEMRVERSAGLGAAARIEALSGRALRRRRRMPARDGKADRYVLAILLLALLTALGWLLVDPGRAFEATVAVLVAACPCAYALAAPTTLTSATGALAAQGVLVTDAAALHKLARVDAALFDKTGTLTLPRAGGNHAAQRPCPTSLGNQFEEQPCPETSGGAENQPRPETDGGAVEEQPRPEARAALDALRADGIAVCIASGDAPERVAALASRLGVPEWHARQRPEDKLALLAALRAVGRVTLAVGDGSNDAPILAAADVSAAPAGGTDLAQSRAGMLLLDGRLDGLVRARAAARKATHLVAQSQRWSLLYNLCAVAPAALGWVPPWLAALGMSASSLLVVMNALRAGRAASAVRRNTQDIGTGRAAHDPLASPTPGRRPGPAASGLGRRQAASPNP